MITNGQMAAKTNQPGYDVISSDNERVSVKTVTPEKGSVYFNKSTISEVDRVIVLRIHHGEDNVSIEIICDKSKDDALKEFSEKDKIYTFSYGAKKPKLDLSNLRIIKSVEYNGLTILRYENGSTQVKMEGGEIASVSKDVLRQIANELSITPSRNLHTRKWADLIFDHLND